MGSEGIYFDIYQMKQMAEFIAGLKEHGVSFHTERDDHRGFYVYVN